MKRFVCFLALCLVFSCGDKREPTIAPTPSRVTKCTVFLAGDSTAAAKSSSQRPMFGWGEKFADFLDGYTVKNKAVGGKSTKTYKEIPEGSSNSYWGKLIKELKKGDVVLIQFGHNDENTSASDGRGTTPDEFYSNLCSFISDVRARDCIPVILTPICRLSFTDGVPDHTHKNYPEMAKKAAQDNMVEVLDIEQLTYDWLATLGEEEAKLRFMVSTEGSSDTTHLTELGATEVAELTAAALKGCKDPVLSALPK